MFNIPDEGAVVTRSVPRLTQKDAVVISFHNGFAQSQDWHRCKIPEDPISAMGGPDFVVYIFELFPEREAERQVEKFFHFLEVLDDRTSRRFQIQRSSWFIRVPKIILFRIYENDKKDRKMLPGWS